MFRWDIEHVEWAFDLDNDPCIQYECNRLAAYKWCRKHKKQFFYAKYC